MGIDKLQVIEMKHNIKDDLYEIYSFGDAHEGVEIVCDHGVIFQYYKDNYIIKERTFTEVQCLLMDVYAINTICNGLMRG